MGGGAVVVLGCRGLCVCPSCLSCRAARPPPQVFAGLLVGAMLPYWFSAMTMKSVGKAALAMGEVRLRGRV